MAHLNTVVRGRKGPKLQIGWLVWIYSPRSRCIPFYGTLACAEGYGTVRASFCVQRKREISIYRVVFAVFEPNNARKGTKWQPKTSTAQVHHNLRALGTHPRSPMNIVARAASSDKISAITACASLTALSDITFDWGAARLPALLGRFLILGSVAIFFQ